MTCENLKNHSWSTMVFIILTVVSLGVSNLLQILAVASSEWDRFDTSYLHSKIIVYQNLWTIKDQIQNGAVRKGLLPTIPNTEWKDMIVRLELTSLVTGVLALVLFIITITSKTLSRKRLLQFIFNIVVVILIATAATTALIGVQTYKRDYLKILSVEAFNPANGIPLDKYKLSWGAHICYGSGGCYMLSGAFLVINVIKRCASRTSSSVKPSSVTGDTMTEDMPYERT